MSAGHLKLSLDLEELVAKTPAEYVAIAAGLATDPGRLQALRASLCDGKAFTRALEQTYRELWRRWCGGTTAR